MTMQSGQYFTKMFLLLPLFFIMPVYAQDTFSLPEEIALDHFEEPETAFNQANLLYIDERFEEAVFIYEQIIESGYHSAELYYNLGNAYYRSGSIPSAILNYERAALLNPGNEDIQFNLQLAGMQVRDRIEALPVFVLNRWWQEARNFFSADTWAVISVAAFIIVIGLIFGFLVSSSPLMKKVFFMVAVTAFIFSVLSFSFGLDQRNYLRNHNSAIVFLPVVAVKSSPDISSTDLFIIHEGTRVRIEESIGEWHSVRLLDGNKGWLHNDAIEKI